MPIVLSVTVLLTRTSRQFLNKLFNSLSANSVKAQRANCALKSDRDLPATVYVAL
jgi:hypothetical protein